MVNEKIEVKLIFNEAIQALKKIPDNSIDFVLTDPPYGTTNAKWDVILPFDELWIELERITKPNSPVLIFGAEPFSSVLRLSNIKNYKYDFYWVKNKATNFLNAKKQPLRNIETISVFYAKAYNPQKTHGHKPVNSYTKTKNTSLYNKTKESISGGGSTERYPKQNLDFNVLNNDNSSGDKIHPTQKPVDLLEYLIKTFSIEGQTVLDFTMGSCSTAIACLNLKRNFIGIEINPDYFFKGCERVKNHLKKLDYFPEVIEQVN